MDVEIGVPTAKATATANIALVVTFVAPVYVAAGDAFDSFTPSPPSINGNSISAIPGDAINTFNLATGFMPVALLLAHCELCGDY